MLLGNAGDLRISPRVAPYAWMLFGFHTEWNQFQLGSGGYGRTPEMEFWQSYGLRRPMSRLPAAKLGPKAWIGGSASDPFMNSLPGGVMAAQQILILLV